MRASTPIRPADDRGAVVVEFALVLPVLMVLLLGMVSGATAWNQSQSLGQGARVAGRYASTLPLVAPEDMDDWLDDIADRAISSSEGNLANGTSGRTVCVAYVDPAGTAPDNTVSRTLDSAGVRTSGVAPCFSDGQSDTDVRVQVELERASYLDVGFWRQNIDLRRTVVFRYEADGGI